jgi:hypothetical protein
MKVSRAANASARSPVACASAHHITHATALTRVLAGLFPARLCPVSPRRFATAAPIRAAPVLSVPPDVSPWPAQTSAVALVRRGSGGFFLWFVMAAVSALSLSFSIPFLGSVRL